MMGNKGRVSLSPAMECSGLKRHIPLGIAKILEGGTKSNLNSNRYKSEQGQKESERYALGIPWEGESSSKKN